MQELENLLRVIRRIVGNKIYLNDLESMFKNIKLTPQQKQALKYLAQDLSHAEHKMNQRKYF